MGKNPSYFMGDDKWPVEEVSWLDAMEFCEKLSAKVGWSYRHAYRFVAHERVEPLILELQG